jgi:tetratricopeptide (TPR) repeat protein
MGNRWLGLLLVLTLAVSAYAEDDPVKLSLQLYGKHRYADAFNFLYERIGAIAAPESRSKANLALGMICLENARLYRQLYRASVAANLDYLTRLIAGTGPNESQLAKLYLGQILLQTGAYSESAAFFNKYLEDLPPDSPDRPLAGVGLGSAYYRLGSSDRAAKQWAGLDLSRPETAAAMAAACSRLDWPDGRIDERCREAADQMQKATEAPSLRFVCDALGVYGRTNRIREGFELLKGADLRGYFHEETIAENTVIRFYDPELLGNLALLYARAAAHFLRTAEDGTVEKLESLVRYHSCRACESDLHPEECLAAVGEALSAGGMPAVLERKLRVEQARINCRLGNAALAEEQLRSLMSGAVDADLAADILQAAADCRMAFTPAVVQGTTLLQKAGGKPEAKLNAALGAFYFGKKDYLKALEYMEAGRDKSNKNRIEFNDPLMLVNLAEAYKNTHKYSETLEIYFEMSKQFPAVRQIQVATQGIYSMEQKSAGDAKIF